MRRTTPSQAKREGAAAARSGAWPCPYKGRLANAWFDGWSEADHLMEMERLEKTR